MKRKAKTIRRTARAASKVRRARTKGEGTQAAQLDQFKDKFIEYLDAGEAAHYDLGALANAFRVTVKGKELKTFWKTVCKGRDKAPSYEELDLFSRVARVWDRSFSALGMSKMSVTLSLLYFMRVPIPSDPRMAQIPVPTPDGGTVTKSFSDCTVREIQAALNKLKEVPPPPIPADIERDSHVMALAIAGVPQHGSAHVSVNLHGMEPTYEFLAFPSTRIRELIAALYHALFPHGE